MNDPTGRSQRHSDDVSEWKTDGQRRRVARDGLFRAGTRVGAAALLLGSMLLIVELVMHRHALPALFDYTGNFDQAADAILRGASPYKPGSLAHLVALDHQGRFTVALSTFAVPVYPPPVLLAALPFALFSHPLGGILFVAMSVLAMIWALRILGVKDWRCHAVALVSWPSVFGLWLGTLSPLLLLGAAAVWRWRAKVLIPAAALAAIVAAKLFPWPVGVWMLMTRRWRTLGMAASLALLTVIGCWAIIGFAGIIVYPHMLSELSSLEDRFGTSVVAQLLALGLPLRIATTAGVVVGGTLLLAAWRVARREGDEARAFALAIMAALTASPLVWPHYFVLAYAPIALLAPRLSPVWFLPMVCGLAPQPNVHLYPWQLCPYLAVDITLAWFLLAPRLRRFGIARAGTLRSRGSGEITDGTAGLLYEERPLHDSLTACD